MNSNPVVMASTELVRVIEFRVAPDQQAHVAELLKEAIETWVKPLPGFLSAHILRSTDGSRVINLAHWATEKDWIAMGNNPTVGPAFELPFRLALDTRLTTTALRRSFRESYEKK